MSDKNGSYLTGIVQQLRHLIKANTIPSHGQYPLSHHQYYTSLHDGRQG